jgi:hypothetical protein
MEVVEAGELFGAGAMVASHEFSNRDDGSGVPR